MTNKLEDMESTDFDVHPAFYAEYESTTLENHDDA